MRMKKTLSATLVAAVLLPLASCKKGPDDILPGGGWRVEAFKYYADGEWNNALDIHTYTFENGGTGRYVYVAPWATDSTFTWSTDGKKKLTINNVEYKVIVNTREQQEWERVSTANVALGVRLKHQ